MYWHSAEHLMVFPTKYIWLTLIHASIFIQACYDFLAVENHFPIKRLPDRSKRVNVPYLFSPQVKLQPLIKELTQRSFCICLEKLHIKLRS